MSLNIFLVTWIEFDYFLNTWLWIEIKSVWVLIPEYFWVYDFSFKLARILFVNDTNYIFLALMLKHVVIATKNIYKIEPVDSYSKSCY
jgi:hypothetical protein